MMCANEVQEEFAMIDQRFFAGKVGIAALVSIVAMVAFNAYALGQSPAVSHDLLAVGNAWVELA